MPLYQFTVDALRQPTCHRAGLAQFWPDHRRTGGPYVFADYLADLDLLLDHLRPGEAIIGLVGRSMGGNGPRCMAVCGPSACAVWSTSKALACRHARAGAHAVRAVDR